MQSFGREKLSRDKHCLSAEKECFRASRPLGRVIVCLIVVVVVVVVVVGPERYTGLYYNEPVIWSRHRSGAHCYLIGATFTRTPKYWSGRPLPGLVLG